MKKVIVSFTAALVLALAGAMIGGRAQAAAISPGGLGTATDEIANLDKVQFIYRGRRYCWYWSAWRGPGWYRCGFRWRRGHGWGGPVGWRGWRRPGTHPPKVNRPGTNRPNANRPGNRAGNRPGGNTNRPGGGSSGSNQPGGSGSGSGPGGGGPGGGSGGGPGSGPSGGGPGGGSGGGSGGGRRGQ